MSKAKHPPLPILIVDDEIEAIHGCESMLRAQNFANTISCLDSRKVLAVMKKNDVGLVLLDLSMPYITGEELLDKIQNMHPEIPIIIFTGHNDLDTAVRCMRKGAFDYMVKPVEEERMITGVNRALEMQELHYEYSSFKNKVLSGKLEHSESFSEIITNNNQMRSVFQYVETIAKTNRPVLITGETGVGKDLLARAVHSLSEREGAFVAVNAAGLDDSVFSDTLFGHKKGAFTDAGEARSGLITKASSGSIFLDEIGDLAASSQVKLLRLLQYGEYFPIGDDVPKQTDARIIVVTNRNIDSLKENGRFRNDLYYRLQTHKIHIPPLRDRIDDLPLLIDFFMERTAKELGKKKPTAPKEMFTLLATYHFPGNVRELESMIFDAISRHRTKMLSMDRFKAHIDDNRSSSKTTIKRPADKSRSPFSLFDQLPTIKQAQSLLIEEAMRRADGNQSVAAQLLGITQPGLSKAIKRRRDGEKDLGVAQES